MKWAFILSALLFATNIPGFAADVVADMPFEYLVLPIIIPLRISDKLTPKKEKADE